MGSRLPQRAPKRAEYLAMWDAEMRVMQARDLCVQTAGTDAWYSAHRAYRDAMVLRRDAMAALPSMMETVGHLLDALDRLGGVSAEVKRLEEYRDAGRVALGLAVGAPGPLADSLSPDAWIDLGRAIRDRG